MLPDGLHNSYLEYKQDTKIYITWICGTAVSCGFTPLYKSFQPPVAQNKSHFENKRPGQREISNKALILCAEAILKKPPKQFTVPLYASKSAARAIRLRNKSTLWHVEQTDTVDETEQGSYLQSNDRHASFTSTLCERSVGTVFQLPNPDAIYSRDEEKERKVGRHLMFVFAHGPRAAEAR
jgi:hypothetical protein